LRGAGGVSPATGSIGKAPVRKIIPYNPNLKELARELRNNSTKSGIIYGSSFYTTHQVYDKDHLIHQILCKALNVVERCSKGSYIYSKCKTVQLDFPEVKDIAVNEATFAPEKAVWTSSWAPEF
jgi:hypothetical protein